MTTVKTAAMRGATFWSPESWAISLVWRRSYIIPTRRKSAPVDRPWLTIWSTPPDRPWLVKAKVPRTMKPRWAMDE